MDQPILRWTTGSKKDPWPSHRGPRPGSLGWRPRSSHGPRLEMILGWLSWRRPRPSVIKPTRARQCQCAEAERQLGGHLQLGSQKEGPVFPQQHQAHRIGFLEAGHRPFPLDDRAVPQFGHQRPGWSLRTIPCGPAQQRFPTELGPQEDPKSAPQNKQVQEQPD